MAKFIIKTGFGSGDFIRISEEEVPIAIKAQVTGKVGVFSEGTIAGNNIISVTPDYHAIMGWNHGYQLQPEDHALIANSRECNEAKHLLSDIRQSIMGGVERPKEITDSVKSLAEKMRA